MGKNNLWLAPKVSKPIISTVYIPPSKSLTNRYLVIASLANNKSTIKNPLNSRDSILMIEALQRLGSKIKFLNSGKEIYIPKNNKIKNIKFDSIEISPIDKEVMKKKTININCGLAGTIMRFMPPLVSIYNSHVIFDGDQSARKRPMITLIKALKNLGIKLECNSSNPDYLPFTIHGNSNINKQKLDIDSSLSSQFISALLIIGCFLKNGLLLRHTGKTLPSKPHIEMTIKLLKNAGVKIFQIKKNSWLVSKGTINAFNVKVEIDLSNAGPFLASALITKGRITIPYWPNKTEQTGNSWKNILKKFGAYVSYNNSSLTVRGGKYISGINIDMSDTGELVPTVVALASLAKTPSKIIGISHLRGHETNRLRALTDEINNLGGNIKELDNGLIINPSKLHGGLFKTYEDHRLATAGAIIGLAVNNVMIENIETTYKTMPDFKRLWLRMIEQ